jgi:hypothetical protein
MSFSASITIRSVRRRRLKCGREIDSARQRIRMKQFDDREKLFHKQCKSGSEEFAIIDEQGAATGRECEFAEAGSCRPTGRCRHCQQSSILMT